MSLDVVQVLREAADRTASRHGVALTVGFAAVGVVSLVARHSYAAGVLARGELPAWYERALPPDPTPLAADVTVGTAVVLWFATAWAGELVRVLGVRAMAADPGEPVHATELIRRLGPAVLNGFVATLLAKLAVAAGLLALVVPGAALGVLLLFVRQAVALDDERVDGALARSWTLARGAFPELLLLCVLWVQAWLGLQLALVVAAVALRSFPGVVGILSVLAVAPLSTFGVAVGTRAYVRLTDDGSDDGEQWPDPPGVEL